MEAVKEVKETVAFDLGDLLDAGDGAVVTLVAGETRLAVHRAVLTTRSPVFEAMFRHDTLESTSCQVCIPDVEGPVMRQLLAYMYTLQAPQLRSMASELLAAADKYGLSDLKAVCEQQVTAQLNVENAAAAAVLALSHSCPSLREAAVAFIKANAHEVVMTQGWADATVSHPHCVVELTRLIVEPPDETSAPATTEDGSRPSPADDDWTAGYEYYEWTAVGAALPTAPRRKPPLYYAAVAYYRSLSEEDRDERLIEAGAEGAVEELQALLAAGADVGAGDEQQLTALHCASREGHLQAVRCLLDSGAQVNARSNLRNTPLHLAAWRGHAAVVRLLLASSADLNARNIYGKTPLHRAALDGHAQAVAALLEAGANKEARDNEAKTPLDLARQNDHEEVIEMLT